MLAPTPAPSADVRAEAIFSRTRAAFVARSYPSTISYTVRVSGFRDGAWVGRSFVSFERWPAERIIARRISEEENANPVRPSGVSLSFLGIGTGKTEQPDILGIPKLAPTYNFGLGALVASPAAESSPGPLRTIGRVLAVARNYDVRLLREENVDGTICWHLRLRALGNPGKYRLRDLWVEETSYQTIRLRTDGNFTAKETGRGYWTVAFTQIDGSWYITSEVSNGPVATADGVYEHIAVQFIGIAADPHENRDFGLGVVSDEDEITEP